MSPQMPLTAPQMNTHTKSIPAESTTPHQQSPQWQRPLVKRISLDITLANGGSISDLANTGEN